MKLSCVCQTSFRSKSHYVYSEDIKTDQLSAYIKSYKVSKRGL